MDVSIITVIKRILEAIFVVALVLAAFLVILLTLNEVFPTGQSLFDLVRPGGEYRGLDESAGRSRDPRLSTEAGDQVLGESADITAVLTQMNNSVKSKRSDQIAWQSAAEGMPLFDRDAVQTFQKSSARLTFAGGNYLDMDEKSLIIVRSLEKDLFLRENRTVVVLMDGQLTGKLSTGKEEAFNLEVVAPGAVTRFRTAKDTKRPARFRMTVKPDETSILTVLEGKADLVVEGKTLGVGTGQIVKVKPGSTPEYISPPPGPPALLSPPAGKVFTFRDISPVVFFSWGPRESVTGYRFMLATDSGFEHIVIDRVISEVGFSHGNLKPGDYYWRISSTNSDQEGEFTRPLSFKMVQDLAPPPLDVHYPDKSLHVNRFELTGTTEPGARVFVAGTSVRTDTDGRFEHSLDLRQGPNVIVVEAVDKVGNVAYLSRIINVEQ